jgi:hypothetical protein
MRPSWWVREFALTGGGGASRTPLPTTTNPWRFEEIGTLFESKIRNRKGYVGGALVV